MKNLIKLYEILKNNDIIDVIEINDDLIIYRYNNQILRYVFDNNVVQIEIINKAFDEVELIEIEDLFKLDLMTFEGELFEKNIIFDKKINDFIKFEIIK